MNVSITMLAFVVITISLSYVPVISAFLIVPSSRIIKKYHRYPATYHQPSHQQIMVLSSTTSHPADQDWSINAIEEARQQFEHLIGPMIFDDDDENSRLTKHKKKPHLLTNAGRKRRNLEIRLLQSLQHSDDAIDELMSLWIYECPNQIVNIDVLQFMSSKDSTCTVTEAELILRNIIQDCPIAVWSEPGARLAYILFLQEQYEECEQVIQSVLSVKPWHFEMIQLQIILELMYHRNTSRAIYLARHYGLPPLHHIKQRNRWVQRATQLAHEQLQQLEFYTDTELHHNPLDDDDPFMGYNMTAVTESPSFTIPSWQ